MSSKMSIEDAPQMTTTLAKAVEALEDNEDREIIFVLSPDQAREKLLFQVKASEEVQDYDAMRSYMISLVGTGKGIDAEERRLFLVAFKNSVGPRRSAWRKLTQLEMAMGGTDALLPHLRLYKSEVEDELEKICRQLVSATGEILVNGDASPLEAQDLMYLHKLRGDYWRYLCEIRRGVALDESLDQAKIEYSRALAQAQGSPAL